MAGPWLKMEGLSAPRSSKDFHMPVLIIDLTENEMTPFQVGKNCSCLQFLERIFWNNNVLYLWF